MSTDTDAKLARNGGTPAEIHPAQLQVPDTPPADAAEPAPAKPSKPARRKCDAPGCRKNIPKTARADAKFCSTACRKAAHRRKSKETP